jgi:4-carboxymuconolactone decarboxylase
MNLDSIRDRYRELLGHVPENIEHRIELARQADRLEAITAIEQLRQTLIHENPLDSKTQQLVHLAMLIGAGETEPARLHVKGALRAGATAAELFGVCETAAIVGGMPAFSRAVKVVFDVLHNAQTDKQQ